MPSIKEYNVKLNSLKNTQKMTNTMKMVAASKLRRAQDAQRNGKQYAGRLGEMISRLAASVGSADHPLLAAREPAKNVLLLLYTSDRGLCGSFNNGMIKNMKPWIEEREAQGQSLSMSFCGRRGFLHYRTRAQVQTHYEGVTARPQIADANRITDDVCQSFLEGEYDEVYLAYNVFLSPLSQKPIIRKLLPIEPEEVEQEQSEFTSDYIFEPQTQELLNMLLPKTISFKVYFALLENAAGEHGARMTAMDSATTNAAKMIDRYTLIRNRARQAAITTELTEIVAGAEAL